MTRVRWPAAGRLGAVAVPAWTIRAPLPAPELVEPHQRAEAATGVPWTILTAVHFVERGWVASWGRAPPTEGPMQFVPSTLGRTALEGDIGDDGGAIAAAAACRRPGRSGRLASALHAYNASDAYVASVLAYHDALRRCRGHRALHGWQVHITPRRAS